MADHVYIQNIAAHTGAEVTIKGWLADRTDKGKLQFLRVRDGTGFIQAVLFAKDVTPEVFDAAKKLTQESSCVITGIARAEPRAPGGFELAVKNVEVVQIANDYPITPKDHGIEFLM